MRPSRTLHLAHSMTLLLAAILCVAGRDDDQRRLSLRTELGRLGKRISELWAKQEPKPTPQRLWREDWQGIHGHLGRAAKKLAEARDAVPADHRQSFLAEFAGDLAREAESLALRANLLSRRAPRKPKVEATEPEPAPRDAPATEAPRDAPAMEKVADLLQSAQRTVETAHGRLGVDGYDDDASTEFVKEIDLLAEMTLSLRQQCSRTEPLSGSTDG